MSSDVRELCSEDHQWVRDVLSECWGASVVVSRGRLHHADKLPGFVALRDGVRVGLVTFRIDGNECEIVTLNALTRGQGVGTALLSAVREMASAVSCRRLWVITTNDNIPARKFYERRGFAVAAVHKGAVKLSRKLKPGIPLVGLDGIPIEDEIEYELMLGTVGV